MRPMRPDDILKIRFVSDPRISPDGRRVAFVLTALSQERDEYLSNIWMVDTTGGAPPLHHGPGARHRAALVAGRHAAGVRVRA